MSKIAPFMPAYSKLVFNEDFGSVKSVSDNGGVAVGSPVIDGQLKLDTYLEGIRYAKYLGALQRLTAFTVVAKVKTPSSFTPYHTLFQVRDTAQVTKFEIGTEETTGKLYFYNGSTLLASNTAVEADKEYLVAWTSDGTTVKFYHGNGSLVSNGSGNAGFGTTNASQLVGMGNRAISSEGSAEGWNSNVSWLQIYDNVLSQEELDDIAEQDTYSELERPIVDLPLRSSYYKENGTDLVGGMTAGGWSAIRDAVLTNPSADVLRVTYDGTNTPTARKTILTVGKRYKLTGSGNGDGSWQATIDDGLTTWFASTTSTTPQSFEVEFVATGTVLNLNCTATGAGYAEFTDVQVELMEAQTENKGSAGGTAQLGDGSTTTTFPTQLSPRGMEWGSGDYILGDGSVFNSVNIGIVIGFKPNFLPSDNVDKFFLDGTSTDRTRIRKKANADSNVLNLYLGGTLIASIAEATYSPFWRENSQNFIIVSGDSTNNLTNVWLNGNKILTDDTTAWFPTSPTNYYLGISNAATASYSGIINYFKVYPSLITASQERKIRHDLIASLNI